MREPSPAIDIPRRAIRWWLWCVAALIFVMVLVGGATRLTESGLSIVEWQPVTGTLPPLSEEGWRAEFEKYKTIPQYQYVNRGMSLAEFKTIYWWEWVHRLLGRLIGAAFLLPFIWFLWKGWVEPGLRGPLWLIFGLGAFQGAVGWWMVASGLAEGVRVSQYRLAFHLTLACLIYVAILWTAERLRARAPARAGADFDSGHAAVTTRLRAGALALLALVLAQIYLGALVSGLRAGLMYNTWPLIDEAWVPDRARLLFEQPVWRNFFENPLTVQFDHRMMAYALGVVALLHAFDASRGKIASPARAGALALAAALIVQIALGIWTLLEQSPILLALAHQAAALIVLTIAGIHAARVCARPKALISDPTLRSAPARGPQ
jgi:cytochrome c oxidase assembly protein subunit 15